MPNQHYELSNEQIAEAYKTMFLLRKAEEQIGQLYSIKKIRGFCHLYIGQEAIATGIAMCKTEQDYVITSYRCHGMILALNKDLHSIIAELEGKKTGCSQGKGGSMHMFDVQNGFYGGHGIVGAQIPIGTGMALAQKYKKTNGITIAMMGDGAVSQGQVYESFNMASVWNLPVLYIVENNQYAMGTACSRATANSDKIYERGEALLIQSYQADGQDLFEAHKAIKTAVDYCRQSQKPALLELKTYRYRGHSMSDPATYRTKEELSAQKHNDPILKIKEYIVSNNIMSEADLLSIEKTIKKHISDTIATVESEPFPDSDDLTTTIYSEEQFNNITTSLHNAGQ